jgi:nitroreductase
MTLNPVLENIYHRRSVRSYSDRPVRDEDIKELIKAGFHAANGVNAQKLRFSVVADKDKLLEYSHRGKVSYLKFMKDAGFRNERLETNLNNKEYNIFYDAPAVIFIYAAPGILTGVEDASLAAGNIMLAARSIGLGTCWIGLAAGLGSDDGFLRDNNIPKDHKLLASIILGYPKDDSLGPSKRPDPEILAWVRQS